MITISLMVNTMKKLIVDTKKVMRKKIRSSKHKEGQQEKK